MSAFSKESKSGNDREIDALLSAVYDRYGFDFRNYAPALLKLKIWERIRAEGLHSIGGFLQKLLQDSGAMERFVQSLSVQRAGMFEDPVFCRKLRHEVLPHLRSQQPLRIWQVGCAGGEQLYTLSIILQEEGMAHRCRIYTTDLNEGTLKHAARGIFPVASLIKSDVNYYASGGRRSLGEYYSVHHDEGTMNPDLRKMAVFAQHNLATDSSFNEFHLILCRNILSVFNTDLRERVHKLLHESLGIGGILCLGPRDDMQLSEYSALYQELDDEGQVFEKVR